MTDLEALVSIAQTLLRNRDQWKLENTQIGDIVNTVWDVVEAFDVEDRFRNVTNQAIREIERRACIVGAPSPY